MFTCNNKHLSRSSRSSLRRNIPTIIGWNEKRKSILSTPKDYYHLSGKDNSVMWTDDEEDDDLESFNIATHSKSLQQRSSDNGNTTLHKHDKGGGVPAVIPHAVISKSMKEEEV